MLFQKVALKVIIPSRQAVLGRRRTQALDLRYANILARP